MEEWISLKEFMKRKKMGQKIALELLKTGQYPYEKTENGRYKIRVGGGDVVSKEVYEKEKERRIQLETQLNLLRKILEGSYTYAKEA